MTPAPLDNLSNLRAPRYLAGRPVRMRWHFLNACPDHALLASVAEQLWLENGLCNIERCDPAQARVYYINKLITEPVRLKNNTRGEYLTIFWPDVPPCRL